MGSPPRADRERVLAFRLSGHNLARRLPPGSALDAAAACGLPDYPPGSAALALGARVADASAAELQRALWVEKSLLQVRSVRTTPLVFPTVDVGIFTLPLAPDDEESCRHLVRGGIPALERVGLSALELADLVGAEALAALDGRALPFRQLSAELAERVSRHLSGRQVVEWESRSPYAADQSLGEALVHSALYVLGARGLICYAPRVRGEAAFARMDQWLGISARPVDRALARAELVRRYLRAYGPSGARHLGEWAGVSPQAAAAMWRLVEAELAPVDLDGRRAWLLRRDLGTFEAPPAPEGVRFLPPHDAFLAQRDREILLPDAPHRRRVWRAAGNPGVVLVAGRLVAVWRARKVGRRLAIVVEPFLPLAEEERAEILREAGLVARLRGCESVDVRFCE